ncbi:hypothetical protein RSP_0003 [Pseudomonas phage RSP]|nr:hypothetical protein RSP_0003 [Pseudomonas phage RSP]
MRFDGKTSKQRATRMVVKELSGVDRPAHAGATVALFKCSGSLSEFVKAFIVQDLPFTEFTPEQVTEIQKRYNEDAELAKSLESKLSGVTNAADTTDALITSISEIFGYAKEKGTQTPAANSGGKSKEGDTMSPEEKKAFEEAKAKAAEMEKKLAEVTAKAEMNDVQKAHFATLDDAGKAEFLKMDNAGRENAVTLAKSGNPVVYKADDGTEFRKNDDPRMVKMAQDLDTERRLAKAERERSAMLTLEKRAGEELKHFPGEIKVKAALLKAVDGIADEETRSAVSGLLKANAEKLARAFQRVGSSGGDSAGSSASEKLDSLAKARAASDKVSYEEAYSRVLDTPEGQELYSEVISGH